MEVTWRRWWTDRPRVLLLLLWAVGSDSCERGTLTVLGPPRVVEAIEGTNVTLSCLYNATFDRGAQQDPLGGGLDVEWTYSPEHGDPHADHTLVAAYSAGRILGSAWPPSPGLAGFAEPGALGESAGDASLLLSRVRLPLSGLYVCRVRAPPCSHRRATRLIVRAVRSHGVMVAVVISSLVVLTAAGLAVGVRARRSQNRRGRVEISSGEEMERFPLDQATPSSVRSQSRGWWKKSDSNGRSSADGIRDDWPRRDSDQDSNNPFSERSIHSNGDHDPDQNPFRDQDSDSHNPFSDREVDDPDYDEVAQDEQEETDDVEEVEEVQEEQILDATNPFFVTAESEELSRFGSSDNMELAKSSGHEAQNPFEDVDEDASGDVCA